MCSYMEPEAPALHWFCILSFPSRSALHGTSQLPPGTLLCLLSAAVPRGIDSSWPCSSWLSLGFSLVSSLLF